jgi:hypothetical protein
MTAHCEAAVLKLAVSWQLCSVHAAHAAGETAVVRFML